MPSDGAVSPGRVPPGRTWLGWRRRFELGGSLKGLAVYLPSLGKVWSVFRSLGPEVQSCVRRNAPRHMRF